jgi:PIN domain nuclease of toxin-antitoxin system
VSDSVIDASALLAVLQSERGAELVQSLIAQPNRTYVSTVNLAEVVAKLQENGATDRQAADSLWGFNLDVVPFDEPLAVATGLLRRDTRSAGLSLGDRACVALAMHLGVPAITVDQRWAGLGLPVEVVVAR